MPQKSYGKMRRSRKKLKGKKRPAITAYLRTFQVGDRVHIDMIPSSPMQHPRFTGKTGTVLERRGRNYIVDVLDGAAHKKIFIRPESLKLQK